MTETGNGKKLSLAERARLAVADGLKAKDAAGGSSGGGTADAVARMAATQRIAKWIRRVLTAVVLLVLIYGVVRYEIYRFPESYKTMLPAFGPGQSVVVDRFPSMFPSMVEDMKAGDVVIFVVPRADGSQAERVARIVARPGDRLSLGARGDGDFCFAVNGEQPLGPGPHFNDDGEPVTAFDDLPIDVPGGHFFVLEDSLDPNAESFDSRDFGFLPFENIRGRVALSWRNQNR